MSLSSARVRSKTGCLTCKKRRKKCDETRPVCERCTKAGMDCLGYSYLEDSDQKVVRVRSKAAARLAAASGSAKSPDSDSPKPGPSLPTFDTPATPASTTATNSLLSPACSQNSLLPLIPGVPRDNLFPTADDHLLALYPGFTHDLSTNGNMFDFSFMSSPAHIGPPVEPQLEGANGWESYLALGGLDDTNSAQRLDQPSDLAFGTPISLPAAGGLFTATPDACDGYPLPPASQTERNSTTDQSKPMTSGQASLLNALFSLGRPAAEPTPYTPALSNYTTPASSQESTWPSPDTAENDEGSVTSEESDPEGIKEIVCGTPALDSTVESNSLPFVLQSYAKWMTQTVYEPLRLAHKLKGWVIERYSHSRESRGSVIMFAGLMNTIWKKGALAADYMPAAAMLGERVRRRVAQTSSDLTVTAKSDVEIDRALEEAVEMITLQCLTSPMISPLGLLIEAAPLFRRACPEAPHELIDLPTKFIHSNPSLRHYAVMDIVTSTALSRSMLFRYNVHYDQDLCNGISEDMGLQWLNGIPDQIILILARMNMLRDDFAPNVDPGVVAEIEQELRDFKSQPSTSTDAYLMVARLAVQECWRLTVFIYLYMGLCGADAKDPRVEKVHKSFMRLFERTKPGRTPDSFLIVPMLLAGIATQRERERGLIHQRLLALQECANPGTCGNEAVLVLEDLWARTSVEGRPVVWSDLRISCAKIMGV